jgi:ribose transport system permease protein
VSTASPTAVPELTTAEPGGIGASVRAALRRKRVLTVIALWVFAIALLFGSRVFGVHYGTITFVWTIITIASFTIVAGFGQGTVVLSGGIDLSIPGVITIAGVMLSQWSDGSNGQAATAIVLVLLLGVAIGIANGVGITLFRVSPVVMTLATNVILGGLVLVVTEGTPKGGPPPIAKKVMQEQILGGMPLVVVLVAVFVVIAVFVLHKTTFGRSVYAVGTNPVTSYLSGISVNRLTISVYAVSGFCAALVGIMLTGYANQAYFGMGDPYLLLSLAAVVVGGASITGGSGYFLGTVAAVLLLTTVTTLLQGTTLPDAVRQMTYAAAIIVAALAAQGGIRAKR